MLSTALARTLCAMCLLACAACARSTPVDGTCHWTAPRAFASTPLVVIDTPLVATVADDGAAYVFVPLEHDERAYGFHAYRLGADADAPQSFGFTPDFLPRAARVDDVLALVGVDTTTGDCVYRELDAAGSITRSFVLFSSRPEACATGRIALSPTHVGALYADWPRAPGFEIAVWSRIDGTRASTPLESGTWASAILASTTGELLVVTAAEASWMLEAVSGDATRTPRVTVTEDASLGIGGLYATAHGDALVHEARVDRATFTITPLPVRIVTSDPPVALPFVLERSRDVGAVSTDRGVGVLQRRDADATLWAYDRASGEVATRRMTLDEDAAAPALVGGRGAAYALFTDVAQLYVSTLSCP